MFPTKLYLIVDPADLSSQDVHVCSLTVAADLLLAVYTHCDVRLLRAHVAALHHLPTGRVRQLARDLDVQLQEPLQGHVRGEPLQALVRDPVLRPAFRALHLEK